MSLLIEFQEYIAKEHLFEKNDRLLIAVSGGMDSIALCELCYQSNYKFAIAHCNFKLRGQDSEDDEAFVKNIAAKYSVHIYTNQFDTSSYANNQDVNIQSAARMLRYEWFNEILQTEKDQPFSCILTAHHADDQAETVMMNFFKGTGIRGLLGMSPKDSGIGGKISRPMLFAKKQTIHSFAIEHALTWREDVSNESSKYSRNFIRNEVIPLLQNKYPQVTDNLLNNVARFSNVYSIYENSILVSKKKLLLQKGTDYHISVLKLLQYKELNTIIFELLYPFGFSANQIPEIVKLLKAETGKYISSESYRIIKNRHWLILTQLQNLHSDFILIEQGQASVSFHNLNLSIQNHTAPFKIDKDNHSACIDSSLLQFPLILRKWKTGDYFYPFGMNKKKKLSRFFIDQKFSLLEKEHTWIVESNKKIVWIVGHRLDNRFRITDQTKKSLLLKVSSSK